MEPIEGCFALIGPRYGAQQGFSVSEFRLSVSADSNSRQTMQQIFGPGSKVYLNKDLLTCMTILPEAKCIAHTYGLESQHLCAS